MQFTYTCYYCGYDGEVDTDLNISYLDLMRLVIYNHHSIKTCRGKEQFIEITSGYYAKPKQLSNIDIFCDECYLPLNPKNPSWYHNGYFWFHKHKSEGQGVRKLLIDNVADRIKERQRICSAEKLALVNQEEIVDLYCEAMELVFNNEDEKMLEGLSKALAKIYTRKDKEDDQISNSSKADN